VEFGGGCKVFGKFVSPYIKQFLRNKRIASGRKLWVCVLLAGLMVLDEILGVLMEEGYPVWQLVFLGRKLRLGGCLKR
jgi:hypothetical protein